MEAQDYRFVANRRLVYIVLVLVTIIGLGIMFALGVMFVANRWLVYIASLLVTIVDFGILFALGVMFVPMMDKFRTSRPATALVQSLMIGMMGISVVVGLLIDMFGLSKVSLVGSAFLASGFILAYLARTVSHLYILISTMAGIGSTTMFMCATVAVGQVFEGKARLSAVAFQMAGIGIGAACYPYLLRYLTAEYGVNGTYLILGGIYLNNVCVGIVYMKHGVKKTKGTSSNDNDSRHVSCIVHDAYECNEQIGGAYHEPVNHSSVSNQTNEQHTQEKGPANKNMDSKASIDEILLQNNALLCCQNWAPRFKKQMKTIFSMPYVFTVIAVTIGQSSLDGYSTVFVDIYLWKTFTEDQGTGSILSYQAFSILFRILISLIRQIKGFDSLAIPITGTLLGCCGLLIIYFSESFIVAYVGTGLLGVSAAGSIAGFGIVVAELVPDEAFGTAFGLGKSAMAVFSISTGPIFGAIRDETHSYAPVLLVIGIMHILAAAFYTMALLWRWLAWKRVATTKIQMWNDIVLTH